MVEKEGVLYYNLGSALINFLLLISIFLCLFMKDYKYVYTLFYLFGSNFLFVESYSVLYDLKYVHSWQGALTRGA